MGQRGGIKLPGGPWYVVRKDTTLNVVYVSKTYYEPAKRRDAFTAGPFNWVSGHGPVPGVPLYVKVRHGPHMYGCTLEMAPAGATAAGDANHVGSSATSGSAAASSAVASSGRDENSSAAVDSTSESRLQLGRVQLDGNDQGLAAGQYAVFYQQGQCLGAAQIQECL